MTSMSYSSRPAPERVPFCQRIPSPDLPYRGLLGFNRTMLDWWNCWFANWDGVIHVVQSSGPAYTWPVEPWWLGWNGPDPE